VRFVDNSAIIYGQVANVEIFLLDLSVLKHCLDLHKTPSKMPLFGGVLLHLAIDLAAFLSAV
jgi:hypothetical protein